MSFGVSRWKQIGTVVGNTSTSEFTFVLKSFQATVGDIIAVAMQMPHGDRTLRENGVIWGRVTHIERYNPFFPFEAAQELGDNNLGVEDTVLSISRDQLQATVLVLGWTKLDDEKMALHPVTYPIQPAAKVLHPSKEAISRLLQGELTPDNSIHIGSLIARTDVHVSLRANPMVARHMAILAMTGGGKTVAARRILRELIGKGYPLLIMDPHGDYLGLWKHKALFSGASIKLFYPHLKMSDQSTYLIQSLISKMTKGLSDPQRELLDRALSSSSLPSDAKLVTYLNALRDYINNMNGQDATRRAVLRVLGFVKERVENMEAANGRLRANLKDYKFEELPDAYDSPAGIVSPNHVSILYLGGYDHLTQSTIVSLVMDSLFQHRAAMTNRIPPFLAVLEEAHNFVPSTNEGQADTPSLESVRRVITEGRKFGTGLLLISQRPSRLDPTILAQCNSFLVLRLVNPKDQSFVKQVMENMSDSDVRALPGFGPGQGIISGQAVRFPLMVQVKFDDDLLVEGIGDENFLEQAAKWSASEGGAASAASLKRTEAILKVNRRGSKSKEKSESKASGRKRRT